MISFFTCVFVVGVCYLFLARDRSIINVMSVAAVYGFVSFIIYTLLRIKYAESSWLNEVLVSVVYMVIMYNSSLTALLITRVSEFKTVKKDS